MTSIDLKATVVIFAVLAAAVVEAQTPPVPFKRQQQQQQAEEAEALNSLVGQPILRDELIGDLLATAELTTEKLELSRIQNRTTRVELPRGTSLKLRGRVWRRRANHLLGPVTFSVEIGGTEVFSREITTWENKVFKETVDLHRFGGREREILLRIENADPRRAGAKWQTAVLRSERRVPRQMADAGPNLMLMMVDTWRADHCSLYGYDRKTTPHLDKFAADARVFDNAISQCSWTAPAVASVLTGLYPQHHGVVRGEPLGESFSTLAETLQKTGVTTFAISTNPLIDKDSGYAQGVEVFLHRPWMTAAEVNQLFLEWLDKNRGLRWFAYLHYIDPHGPYNAPAPLGGTFADTAYDGIFRRPTALNELFHTVNFGKPAAHPYTDKDLAFLEAAYDGEILYWDESFGQLVEGFSLRQLLDGTAFIITSDHGEEFTEHGKFKHGHQLYDESVRVPLVIRAPDLRAGRIPAQVETRGIYRAALQLMKLGAAQLQGDDVLRVRAHRFPAFSHTVHMPEPGQGRRQAVATVRFSDWKLIRWLDSDRTELFNLAEDPGEAADVLSKEADRAAEFGQLLDDWLADGAALDSETPLDPKTLDKLRALGYVQ